MRFLIVAVLVVLVGGLRAAVEWPADFDAKLAQVIAAWQPSGTASVESLQTLDGEDIMAGGRGFSAAYGSVEEPFDVNWHTFDFMFFEGVFRSTPPTGFGLFLR